MKTTQPMVDKAMAALHVALLVASVAVLAMPSRQALVYPIFHTLFLVQSATTLYRTWRLGLLTSTPGQIARRLQSTGKRVFSGPLERLAVGVGFITMAIAAVFYKQAIGCPSRSAKVPRWLQPSSVLSNSMAFGCCSKTK